MTAEEIYESVTDGGATDFAEVVAILDEIGGWCLIGGLAVNSYVEPVYTVDADIVVVSGESERVRHRLSAAGYAIEDFAHSFNARKAPSKLSLQFTIDDRYQEFIATAARREVLGENVPVASLENVVRGKTWAWSDTQRRATKRKKDELDLLRIAESYPELRERMPPQIVAQLAQEQDEE
ncbi:MAG: hypothetical protein M3Z64_11205 [Verrucomicrobiota bacterium]|nr:hypothetical protein [Verrucomicrobiota bacterium]